MQQRQKILDAALAIVSEKGFAALSMRLLAERVEYSAAAIYLYFKNRDQLAHDLRRLGFERLLSQMEAAASGLEGHEALHALGDVYVHFGRTESQLYRLMFMGEREWMQAAYADMASDTAADRAYQLLLRAVQSLQGSSSQEAAPTEVADVIWSCLHGIVSLDLALPGLQATQPEIQGRLALQLLSEGIGRIADSSRPQRPE